MGQTDTAHTHIIAILIPSNRYGILLKVANNAITYQHKNIQQTQHVMFSIIQECRTAESNQTRNYANQFSEPWSIKVVGGKQFSSSKNVDNVTFMHIVPTR